MRRRSMGLAGVAGGVLLAGAVGPRQAAQADEGSPLAHLAAASALARSLHIPGVRVMTQNMYIGLDVFPIIAAPLEELPFAVAQGFADFVANRPEDRIAAIANEVALVQPHLIGLQEVVQLFEQFPSDAVGGNLTPNASDEVIDFLEVLLEELAARGLTYEVAARQLGADLELPRFDGVVDGQPVFSDVRSKFSDVILRRAGIATSPLFAINYAAALPIPSLPGVGVPRNALGVKATVGGSTFRFVSTHLESLVDGLEASSQPQLGQVSELIELLANEHEPELTTVVVGDFNSLAGTGPTYRLMADAGYTDVWNERADLLGQSGLTCCQDVVLTNPQSNLSERIDYVWTSNVDLSPPTLAFTLGDQPVFRTAESPRLWPSDHAGLAALLLL
jgi:endonuclease/exonuclease/phosphatase family metal-dependent hydrolase